MLAMEVNDDAGSLAPRGALRFFVGTPPGACSLLQGAVLLRFAYLQFPIGLGNLQPMQPLVRRTLRLAPTLKQRIIQSIHLHP